MKGGGEHPLTVVVRIRPLNNTERLSGAAEIAHTVEDKMVVLMDPTEDPDDILRANRSREKQYVFDYALDASSSQEEVYQNTTSPLIKNVMSGYNGTVFAYGATGAGKTHTMLGTDSDPGIYARTLNDLFQAVGHSEENIYAVTMSYLEIYNEMIRDLLSPMSGYLEMREDAKGGVQVAGLTEISTASTGEIMSLLQRGNRERTQEPTKANKTSSRSHAILQIIVKQRSRDRSVVGQVRIGRLFLVDLAGSERAANTQNRGKRMVEGAHINRSLLALGNCITALSENKGPRYVNYRDSKLTRLLKDALGGNCKTVMIAHVSPSSFQFEESRNTLLYADRAKMIKNKIRRNVEDVKYHVAQYTAIISELKEEISRLRSKLHVTTAPGGGSGAGGALGPAPNKIQAIQYEVLHGPGGGAGAAGRGSYEEFIKLKEQLMLVFRDQMDQRRALMALNNRSAELGLELGRTQQVISDWEEGKGEAASDPQLEKQLEYEGSSLSTSGAREPDEVQSARQELTILTMEKKKTDYDKANATKQLYSTKQKASQLEENLPKFISSDEQKQILELLLRTHELEIQNTELSSQIYVRDFDLAHKDEALAKFQAHKSMADDIIRLQQEILIDHSYPMPQMLSDLYYEYNQEFIDGPVAASFTKNFSITDGSLPTTASGFDPAMLERLSTLAEESQSRFSSSNPRNQKPIEPSHQGQSPALSPYGMGQPDDPNKVFSRTPRSQQMQHTMSLPRLIVSPMAGVKGVGGPLALPKEDTIHTLSIRSNSFDSTEPRVPGAVPTSPPTGTIETKTRGIAALAAKKRKQMALEHTNNPSRLSIATLTDPNLNKTFISIPGAAGQGDEAGVAGEVTPTGHLLTPSRLARHTQNYLGSGMTAGGADDGAESVGTRLTDGPPPRGRGKVRGTGPSGPVRPLARNYDKSSLSVRARGPKEVRQPMTVKGPGRRALPQKQGGTIATGGPRYLDLSRTSRNSLLTSTASLQSNASKKSTKGSRADPRKSKHPTIPQYKRGDITITGQRLQ